jgi:hypothetical protein
MNVCNRYIDKSDVYFVMKLDLCRHEKVLVIASVL